MEQKYLGIVLFDDLKEVLESGDKITVRHQIESS